MQKKTIKIVIEKKLTEWLETITDVDLRKDVKDNLLVSGGCIASMLLKETVNDFDIYIKDMDVLIKLANYYCPNLVLDGRLREKYLKERADFSAYETDEDFSEQTIRYKTLKEDQVKLDIPSIGIKKEIPADSELKYQVSFLSQNAISLTNDIQIVLRFHGDSEQIHKTFDFIHATNYFTFNDGLVLNNDALESLLTKNLKYQGSLYPLTSIIRMKKFLKRNWQINAGEILKIMFQISQLDLTDPEILEEQLIGVDVAYFSKLIEILRGVKKENLTSQYISSIIEKVFNDFVEDDENNIQ